MKIQLWQNLQAFMRETNCGGPALAALIHADVHGVLIESSKNNGKIVSEDQRI